MEPKNFYLNTAHMITLLYTSLTVSTNNQLHLSPSSLSLAVVTAALPPPPALPLPPPRR